MSENHFEPFGESIEGPVRQGSSGISGEGSATLRRAGTGVFWALVVLIVTARVLYFNPDFEKSFAGVKTFISSLTTYLS